MDKITEIKKVIDVEKIMQTKAPDLYKKLPRFVINYFIRVLHQDEVNEDLHKISDLVGVPKFHKHLAINNINIDYHGLENVPKDGRFIFASNHPFGGPDAYHYYKLFILCEIIGGEATLGIETSNIQFFSEDNLPQLSTNRNTESQIKTLFEFLRNPEKPTLLD